MDYTEKINRLANLIKNSSCTLALTGPALALKVVFLTSGVRGPVDKDQPNGDGFSFCFETGPAAFYKTNLMSWTGFTEMDPTLPTMPWPSWKKKVCLAV
ncbi:MAG: hypothetical protein RQM92_00930 [Candidatus Syntrophopropionicum ammoniitolerans]